jgi:hypothetical protein
VAHTVIVKPHYESSGFASLNTKIAPQVTAHILFFAELSNHVENVTTQGKKRRMCRDEEWFILFPHVHPTLLLLILSMYMANHFRLSAPTHFISLLYPPSFLLRLSNFTRDSSI